MKKLLTATTALALVGGAAFAEMTMTGSAELGFDYSSEPEEGASKHTFAHDVGIAFSGSATTDGGLSFGASVGLDNKSGGGSFDDGSVSVSGAFGTVSIGDVGRASELAGGIADVGLNGVGVDDIVEDMRETSVKQINYSNSFGQIEIAFSAGNTVAIAAVPQVVREAMPASQWWFFNHDGERFQFNKRPGLAQYGMQFGIVPTFDDNEEVTALTVTAGGASTDIFGYSRGEMTDVEGSTGIYNDADTPVQLITGTDDAAIAAFRRYEAAFEVGDSPIDGTESRTSDEDDEVTRKVVTEGKPADPSDTEYAFGMKFNTGGVTVGFGYDSNKTVSAGLGFSQGDIGANALYVKQDNGDTGVGVDMSYTMGASSLVLAYAKGEDEGVSSDAMGVNFSHDLGGGASLVSGFGQVNDVNKASMGVSFSF